VYTTPTRGGPPMRRLTSSLAADTAPAWSQDGATLAFSSNRSGLPKVYSISATGGGMQLETDGATMDGQPSWKPTGDAITFAQLQAPAPADIFWGIYSAPRDGMGSTQVIEQLESEV